jgi:hypothetical protein
MTASEKIPSGKNGKKKKRKQMWVKVCDCYSRDQERIEKQSGQKKESHETGRTIKIVSRLKIGIFLEKGRKMMVV